jgi:GT2 family glycosyltransferase
MARVTPLVSYIVVTRNRPKELSRCLQSIQQQNYPHKQVIVVDNGTPDQTRHAIRQRLPEAEHLALSENIGAPAARNRAIDMAHGAFLIFLDDDAELCDPQATLRVAAYFQRDPQLAGVAFRVRSPQSHREARNAIPRADKREIPTDYDCTYFCACGCAIRRDVFETVGKFWEQLQYGGEELDFAYRALEAHYTFLCSATVEVVHWESSQERPAGRWYYVNARNRAWIAGKYLPWPCVCSTLVMWWSYLVWKGYVSGQIYAVLRGIRDALAGFPAVFQERRQVSRSTIQTLRALSGRLWF